MRTAERRKVNVLDMKCLRSLVGVLRMDSVSNLALWLGGCRIQPTFVFVHVVRGD